MRLPKVGLNVFFALCLAIICLAAAGSIEKITGIKSDRFLSDSSLIWFAIGGFVLGLLSAVYILKRLSSRTVGMASIALGTLAFIAIAILIYLYVIKSDQQENEKGSASKEISGLIYKQTASLSKAISC